MNWHNKKLIMLLLLAINSPLCAMSSEEDMIIESKVDLRLPYVLFLITQELSKTQTKEETIKDILNLFQTNRLFASLGRDPHTNGLIIEELASRYFEGNYIKAALALNTVGAAAWLAEYFQQNKELARQAWPLLFEAIYKKNNRIALTLLAGLHSNARDRLGRTPLIAAVGADNIPVMQELLKRGAAVDAKDIRGNSALHYAVRVGNIESAKLLLDNGAQIDSKNSIGITPLAIAIEKGNELLAESLIAHGADVTIANNRGLTPLIVAAQKKLPQLVSLLLTKGANITSADHKGFTALDWAAVSIPETRTSAQEIVCTLVNAGAAISYTALNNALESGDQESVEFLIDKGAVVNSPVGTKSPLMHAITSLFLGPDAYLPMINLLLARGADVNAQNQEAEGKTPLMYAVTGIADEEKRLKIIKILLNAGADVSLQTTQGQTALTFAEQQHGISQEVITLLTPAAPVDDE